MPLSAGEIAGIYGAVVATASLAWQVYRRRRDERSDVRVQAIFDVVPEGNTAREIFMADYNGVRVPGFFISVFNAGARTEHLAMIGMGPRPGVSDPTALVWFPGEPEELPARGSITRWIPLSRLARDEEQWAFCAQLASDAVLWSDVVKVARRPDPIP